MTHPEERLFAQLQVPCTGAQDIYLMPTGTSSLIYQMGRHAQQPSRQLTLHQA